MNPNTTLLITALIFLSSFLFTNLVDKSYSPFKLPLFLIFYYCLILLGAFLGNKYIKKNGKMIGSVAGFLLSVLLWFKFGDYAKNT
jgi:Na+/proline symporter